MARFLFLLISLLPLASAFSSVPTPLLTKSTQVPPTILQASPLTKKTLSPQQKSSQLLMIRGGEIIPIITSSLQSGPYGVLGLWAIASAVVIPCTLYRQAFSFSVGYGFSVMTMAIALGTVFGFSPLVVASVFYGARLGSFLLLRNVISEEKSKQTKSFDKTSRPKRIPFAASVALFPTFLMTPVLYALRFSISGAETTNIALQAGTVIAWVGAGLEAIADTHKLVVKQSKTAKTGTFVGPTSGVYGLTRHPNYTGEVIFWLGLLVSGIPTFGRSVVGWGCSLLGFYGIYGIMTMATKRLDEKQLVNYGGQKKYDAWRKSVKAPIFPFWNVE